MPTAEEGDRVKVAYTCRLEDGTILDFTDRDALEFIIGEGTIMPELEKGVMGMHPREKRTLRIPAAEVDEFRFVEDAAPNAAGFPAGTTMGDEEEYDIGPGEEADDDEELSNEGMHLETSTTGIPDEDISQDYIFDIELLEIKDPGVDLGADSR